LQNACTEIFSVSVTVILYIAAVRSKGSNTGRMIERRTEEMKEWDEILKGQKQKDNEVRWKRERDT
jgi:hypothetical protein